MIAASRRELSLHNKRKDLGPGRISGADFVVCGINSAAELFSESENALPLGWQLEGAARHDMA